MVSLKLFLVFRINGGVPDEPLLVLQALDSENQSFICSEVEPLSPSVDPESIGTEGKERIPPCEVVQTDAQERSRI